MYWKSKIGYLLFFVLMWMIFSVLYSLHLIYYIQYFVTISGFQTSFEDNAMAHYFYSYYQLLEALLFGFFFGIFNFFIFTFTERIRRKNRSFLSITLYKTGLFLLSFAVVSLLVYWILVKNYDFFENGALQAMEWKDIPKGLVILLAASILGFILFLNLLIEFNYKYGVRHLFNIVLGRYYYPRAQEKIFMFLDLKSSTHYAERLGHLKISALLQECFFELNLSAEKFEAEIYQYIGDEAVLTWDANTLNRKEAPIALFFDFERRLSAKKEYFLSKYEFIPEFKAGVNIGSITIVEVGYTKRELAYHGDTINTASRVQHLCNELGVSLLITAPFKSYLDTNEQYTFKAHSPAELKGKHKKIDIFSVSALQ